MPIQYQSNWIEVPLHQLVLSHYRPLMAFLSLSAQSTDWHYYSKKPPLILFLRHRSSIISLTVGFEVSELWRDGLGGELVSFVRGAILLVESLAGPGRRHHAGDWGHRGHGGERGERGEGGEGGGRGGGGGGHHLWALVQQRGHRRRLWGRRQGTVTCKQRIYRDVVLYCIHPEQRCNCIEHFMLVTFDDSFVQRRSGVRLPVTCDKRSPDAALVFCQFVINFLFNLPTFIGLPHALRPNQLHSILGSGWDTISFSFLVTHILPGHLLSAQPQIFWLLIFAFHWNYGS